jgi:site-specific DNA recombinase
MPPVATQGQAGGVDGGNGRERYTLNMRLLIAARLSQLSDGQTGLDTQDAECGVWAKANGHTVVHTAADRKSGTSAPWDRPNLRPWVTEPARLAQYDAVLAYRLDRLSRGDDESTSDIEAWARRHGKQLLTVDGLEYPCEGDAGIRWDVTKRIAHQEWRNASERYRRMQRHLRSEGYLVGKPVYGFTPGPDPGRPASGHHILVLHPAEAAFIREAVSRYLAGASLREVCKWLDSAGSVPRSERAAATWSPSSLDKVFRNTSLIGRRSDENGRLIMRHEPVLDLETWDKLQAEMDRRAKRTGVAPAGTALLTGVAVCAICGGPMYRVACSGRRKDGSKNTNLYYRCHGSSRDRSTCRNLVPLAELDSWVDQQVRTNGGQVTEVRVTPGSGHDDEIAQVDADIAALDPDDTDWLAKVQEFRAERARLKALPSEPAVVSEEIAPFSVGDIWALLDPAQRREYLLSAGVTVRAVRGDYRLDGDPARLARALKLGPDEHARIWQALNENSPSGPGSSGRVLTTASAFSGP